VWENSIECCATRKYIQGRKAFKEKKMNYFLQTKIAGNKGRKKIDPLKIHT
jgi:hypothetical protein